MSDLIYDAISKCALSFAMGKVFYNMI